MGRDEANAIGFGACETSMEYRQLVNQRIRQEAQRCLRAYHEAYRQRQVGVSPLHLTSSLSPTAASASHGDAASVRHGTCWKFYRGQLPASPGKETVDDLLAYGGEGSSRGTTSAPAGWCPDELERRHDYIQWLFPLRERGVNWLAPLLTTPEADAMRGDGLVMTRVLQALRMMLRFYGAEIAYTVSASHTSERKYLSCSSSSTLCDARPGHVYLHAQLRRTSDHGEWAAQYDNLLRRSHNCLRISRILQFLGEVGLEPLKLGWLEYLARETIAPPSAQAPLAACRGSFFFWMETPFEEQERQRLQRLVEELASCSTPSTAAAAAGPVVMVRNLKLPYDLDLARLTSACQVASLSNPTPAPFERDGTRGTKRSRA